jgi:GTP pyrophosphokinase
MEEWQKEMANSNEFLEFLKIDLFPAEVFIFTPKGDIIQLPKGATALDFAFAVHTTLGIHCIGCKVNGQLMPIDTPLKSGSTVEILRSENQNPNLEWLRFVRTTKAKSALRRWLNQEGAIRSRDLGKEILLREYQRLGLKASFEEWLKLAANAQMLTSVDRLLEMVGKGELSAVRVLHEIPAIQQEPQHVPMMRRFLDRVRGAPVRAAIGIENAQNIMIRLARCCMPVPGEKIVGFITKGRGLSVHRVNCPNIVLLASEIERQVSVEWDTKEKTYFKVRIEVIAKNRLNLLAELTQRISSYNSHIVNANISTRENMVHDVFMIEVLHLRQLKKILSALKKVKGVQKVGRGRLEESPFAKEEERQK